MNCPFCGGELILHNEHWIDPMVECSCSPHLIRLSEIEAHLREEGEEVA